MKCFLLAFLISTAPAMACESDTDCLPGTQCLKTYGSLYGICSVGGLSPLNSNDRQPMSSPWEGNRTYANTCSFDIDCSPGSHCSFQINSSEGLCMK
jgi:hypothetical protein